MGLQLILCMETNSKIKSDYLYIKSTIEHFYVIDNSNIKLSPVYMGGKGNYLSNKIRKQINDHIKQYKATSKNNKSKVIMCFDCDDYDTKPEDMKFLVEARCFCEMNEYQFVWFCKDIEDVYLGKRISDSDKKKEAEKFSAKKLIKTFDMKKLCAKEKSVHRSNLCSVLDEYLKRNK